MSDFDDDDGPKKKKGAGKDKLGTLWTEFDCPGCDANNPQSEGFHAGDEVLCLFCGVPYVVKAFDEDRFKLIQA